MLDRRDADIAFDQRRGESRVADVFRTRPDIDGRINVDAAEHDAGVDRCRTQRHVNLFTRMETDARRANDVFQSTLLDHFLYFPRGQEMVQEIAKRAES